MHDCSVEIRKWVSQRLPNDVNDSLQRLARAADVRHLAVMPDVHLARDVCIGTVVATESVVYPAAVGGDIGCGVLAIGLHATADQFDRPQEAARLLSALYETVPQNRHRQAKIDSSLNASWSTQPLSHQRLEKLKGREGRVQLGTLGRGNHFLEFQADRDQRLWLMIHSGSRSMGQAITNHHLENAERAGLKGRLVGLDTQSDAGSAYLHDMDWARTYAWANRTVMMEATLQMLHQRFGIQEDRSSVVHTDHNHVAREQHLGHSYWVHRKGAQRLAENQIGLVPGSMGTHSYIVAGRAEPKSLSSCSHGAGRQLSRTEAKRKITSRSFTQSMTAVWFDKRKQDRLKEEAPAAYKDIDQVMRDQRQLVRIVARHRPILSFKGN